MWLVKNKIWAGDYKIFVNKPTRNAEGYWEDLTETNNERRYGYVIPHNEFSSNITWEHEPLKIIIDLEINFDDEKPIYMIAEAEEGSKDCYDRDFEYGYCPLSKYATDSKMTSSKPLPKSSHGYGCAGYVVKTTLKYLKLMGWEADYEKYKTTEEMWNGGYKNYSVGLFD